jgi:GMP synthase-like glutamine amidotransferase
MTEPDLRALVLQHLPVEHPAEIGKRLRQRGFDLATVELDEGEPIPELEMFDLMIAMGGPMDVWQENRHHWLVPEKAAIRRWVTDLGRPFLGVCLGHQLLAAALGGDVGPMARPEVGVHPIHLTAAGCADPLLGQLSIPGSPVHVLQWHGAEVKVAPHHARILATSPACAVQAIHVPPAAWGVQFHVEIDAELLRTWLDVPEYRASLDATLAGGANALTADVVQGLPAMLGYSAGLADRLAARCRAIRGGPAGE